MQTSGKPELRGPLQSRLGFQPFENDLWISQHGAYSTLFLSFVK